MTDMLKAPIHRYDVTFEATEIDQGRSIVGVVLSRDGAISDHAPVLFFEPKEDMTPEDTRLLAHFLNQYITGFGLIMPEGDEPQGAQETSEQA
jgi:hypothetical protein